MFGERVRRIREAAGITQTELGKATGVTSQMIYRIEKGTKAPSLALAKDIAAQLGVTLDELLREEDLG